MNAQWISATHDYRCRCLTLAALAIRALQSTRYKSLAFTVTLLSCCVSLPLSGQTELQPSEQFTQTSFTREQGAPGAVHVLAQTTDGYLWLGTETGLVRFDGVRFERYEAPRFQELPFSNVSALLATRDGGLWIGYRTGGASFLHQEMVTNYGASDGLPSAQVFGFDMDGDGVVWISTSRGVRRLANSHWDTLDSKWGVNDKDSDKLMVGDDGRLWLFNDSGLYSLAAHAQKFTKLVGSHDTAFSLIQTVDGVTWVIPERRGVVATVAALSPADGTVPVARLRLRGCHATGPFCAASDGSVWLRAENGQVERMPNIEWLKKREIQQRKDSIHNIIQVSGIKANYSDSFLEDREGDMWVSTNTGIERFRHRNVYNAPFPKETDLDLSLVAGSDGTIFAGAEDGALMEASHGTVFSLGPKRHVVSMYKDRAGLIWIGGLSSLTTFANGKFQDIRLPDELGVVTPSAPTQWKVRAITEDGGGSIWVSVVQHGVFRRSTTGWRQYGNLSGLPKLTALTLATDSQGRVWFGYTENRVAMSDVDVVRTFSGPDGLDVGNVTAVAGRTGHVWVGGQHGLARFDGSRFQMLTTPADGDFRGISGIVETESGDLWLNQTAGLAHLTAKEIEVKFKNPGRPIHYELFDNRDGLRGTATQFNFLPSLALASDGRIWVSGTEGASWIDPTRIYKNAVPPPVSIQLLIADGHTYTNFEPITLPPLPSNLEIDYTALSLSIPERVRFRYKLVGVDTDWQNVGPRRTAYYTKLSSGEYQFLVMACNNDGIWNETPASWNFVVSAAYYQTLWFRALCLAAAACALWFLYLYRVQQVTAHVQERLGVRLEERERIARELHDTLLQGFQGLMLRFQGVLNLLPQPGAAHQLMESVLDRADQVLVEGRDRVRDLRSDSVNDGELGEGLTRIGDGLEKEHGIAFSLAIIGTPVRLDPSVWGEAYRIGNEAISNAFRHSLATKIEVEITYDRSRLRVTVRDDGKGIDAAVLESGRAGHWGLSGMRERAERIGAQMNIWSTSGAGTEVDLVVPGNVAYLVARPVSLWRRISRPRHRT